MPERLPSALSERSDLVARPPELTPEHRDVLRLLGYFLLRQDRPIEAVAVFRGLLATDREDRHAQRALVYSYLAAGEPDRALEIAASYAPHQDELGASTIHLLRAQALWRLGRQDEARASLQRFIDLRDVS